MNIFRTIVIFHRNPFVHALYKFGLIDGQYHLLSNILHNYKLTQIAYEVTHDRTNLNSLIASIDL